MNVLITVMPHREGGEGGESEVSSFSSEVLTPATAVWGLCRHWLSLPLCLPLTSLLPSLQLPKQGAGDNNSYVLSPAPCHTFHRHQFHLYLLCRVRPVHTAVSEPLSGKFIWVQMPLPLWIWLSLLLVTQLHSTSDVCMGGGGGGGSMCQVQLLNT